MRGAATARRAQNGMTGRTSRDGCATVWCTRFTAWITSSIPSSAIVPPVLVLRSKRGKLLLETSRRMRCPVRKTFAVATRSTRSS